MNLIVIVVLISISISIYILFPIIKKYLINTEVEIDNSGTDPEYKNLIREKDQLLNEIMDIDLDYGLEKLGDKDYKELRQKYRLKAAGVIKKIENYEKLHNTEIDMVLSKKIDDEIENFKRK